MTNPVTDQEAVAAKLRQECRDYWWMWSALEWHSMIMLARDADNKRLLLLFEWCPKW